ncbi:MAG TPA: hypothetical protein VFQ38_14560 [Longimicrobiales bacterium]|nr:hypothetical protein [Longimicrobiales bacterium]
MDGARAVYAAIAVLWLLTSLGGGALMAFVARRQNPALPFRRMWFFYAALLAFAVAGFMAIALRH